MPTFNMSFLAKGCIVSCQALEQEPLHSPSIMAAMARAAQEGGAVGIRANSPEHIRAIKEACDLPIIGLYKREHPNSEVYITPTLEDASSVIHAGADIVALDATNRIRPDYMKLEELIAAIRETHPSTPILADISTFEEGVLAMDLGVDLVSTTLSGYTPYSPQQKEPDIELVGRLAELRRTPVLAEGRIWTPDECRMCFAKGAFAVVIGSAITRPQLITRRFVDAIKAIEEPPVVQGQLGDG